MMSDNEIENNFRKLESKEKMDLFIGITLVVFALLVGAWLYLTISHERSKASNPRLVVIIPEEFSGNVIIQYQKDALRVKSIGEVTRRNGKGKNIKQKVYQLVINPNSKGFFKCSNKGWFVDGITEFDIDIHSGSKIMVESGLNVNSESKFLLHLDVTESQISFYWK